jgi:hypothetical protein
MPLRLARSMFGRWPKSELFDAVADLIARHFQGPRGLGNVPASRRKRLADDLPLQPVETVDVCRRGRIVVRIDKFGCGRRAGLNR